jgi:hypothetical protein
MITSNILNENEVSILRKILGNRLSDLGFPSRIFSFNAYDSSFTIWKPNYLSLEFSNKLYVNFKNDAENHFKFSVYDINYTEELFNSEKMFLYFSGNIDFIEVYSNIFKIKDELIDHKTDKLDEGEYDLIVDEILVFCTKNKKILFAIELSDSGPNGAINLHTNHKSVHKNLKFKKENNINFHKRLTIV